jgi:NodT family efflux transporter outer membrane factor (OMF) lipoprotein
MRTIYRTRCVVIPALLALAACASTRQIATDSPTAKANNLPSAQHQLPSAWRRERSPQAASAQTPTTPWWKDVADPSLDALLAQALHANLELANSRLGLRRMELLQQLSGQALSAGVSAATSYSDTLAFADGGNRQSQSVQLNASARYELDLFGRLRDARQIAAWNSSASRADARALQVSVAIATMRQYWQLCLLAQQQADLVQDRADSQRVLKIARSRYAQGVSSRLELNAALDAQINLENQKTALTQQRAETLNALALLLGQPEPDALLQNLALAQLDQRKIPAIAAGIPAAILANRPDLISAQLRLSVAGRNVALAQTALYPSVALTANLGSASADLRNLLSNPIATLAANLAQPFLEWRTTKLRLNDAQLSYQQAVLSFQETLHQALIEVENTLLARDALRQESATLRQSLRLQAQNARISLAQYQAGATDVRSWLSAQRGLRSARLSLARQQLNRLNNHVLLLRALGLTSVNPADN